MNTDPFQGWFSFWDQLLLQAYVPKHMAHQWEGEQTPERRQYLSLLSEVQQCVEGYSTTGTRTVPIMGLWPADKTLQQEPFLSATSVAL